jgi:hypothetical protein
MKQLTCKWKYSKKRGAWIMKWKRRKDRRPGQAGGCLLMQSLSMTDGGVWAVMTSHGTYYIVDLDKAQAMRVPAEGRGALVADRTWSSRSSARWGSACASPAGAYPRSIGTRGACPPT